MASGETALRATYYHFHRFPLQIDIRTGYAADVTARQSPVAMSMNFFASLHYDVEFSCSFELCQRQIDQHRDIRKPKRMNDVRDIIDYCAYPLVGIGIASVCRIPQKIIANDKLHGH